MKDLQIEGVRELTLTECEEINGGVAPFVVAGGMWLAKALASAVISYGVYKGFEYLFYS